jgi:hypothetical protein
MGWFMQMVKDVGKVVITAYHWRMIAGQVENINAQSL